MSLFVLVAAAGHAIPPIIGGVVGKSKNSVIAGAAIACVIAIASGSPVFIVADLIGAGLGAWLGFSMVSGTNNETK
ncbi:MAG: hypothetical protein AB1717_01345 [Pseudomonadota bacterium]